MTKRDDVGPAQSNFQQISIPDCTYLPSQKICCISSASQSFLVVPFNRPQSPWTAVCLL